jgi:hypothetical protein
MNVPSRRTINTNIETVYDIYILKSKTKTIWNLLGQRLLSWSKQNIEK